MTSGELGGRGDRDVIAGDGLGRVVVGLRVTMAASTIALESNDGTSAEASVETAASGGAVAVRAAGASNELSSAALDQGCPVLLSRRDGNVVPGQLLGSVVVRLGISVAATTITLEGNDGASTEASVETAASLSAIAIGGAFASDELGAGGSGSSGG